MKPNYWELTYFLDSKRKKMIILSDKTEKELLNKCNELKEQGFEDMVLYFMSESRVEFLKKHNVLKQRVSMLNSKELIRQRFMNKRKRSRK